MFCIAIILDVFSLSVFAKLTLYFKFSLVSIVCSFLFSGNRSFSLLFLIQFFANFKHKSCLLFSSESKFSSVNELS